jgi:hypothetical protein
MLRTRVWTPKTSSDRSLLLQELSAILASPPFSNSKRYPAFLRYVVEKSLNGQAEQLKERTIGTEVFGRHPDYDTNADPVVRVSAGEVRKRIAQYYHSAAGESQLLIELPIGSYTPEFKKRITRSKSTPEQSAELLSAATDDAEPPSDSDTIPDVELSFAELSTKSSKKFRRLYWALCLALLLTLAGWSAYFYYHGSSQSQLEQLWRPLVRAQEPVLIVIGCGKPWLVSPESPETSLSDHMIGPYHHVSVSDAVAVSRLANVLQGHHRTYLVKEASATSLADLRERTVILVGALNNIWTLRLTSPLRFQFVPGTKARIEDIKNPKDSVWSVDYSQPYPSVSVDYGIIARYRDTYTNGNVLVVAGIGPYGTEAASEFVSSPQYADQITRLLPNGFKEANLELVVRTEVTRGEAGPPHLVAAYAF